MTTPADREPLTAAAVTALLPPGAPWRVMWVPSTASTNADLVAAAAAGADHGTVLIAEEQTSGRGRLGRTWTAPAGSGLTLSVLLRLPDVPPARRGWAGVLLGMAAARVCRERSLSATLKWPNDLLIDGNKVAGVLAEATPTGVVVGIGLNVTLTRAELPRADATSLLLAGAATLDRADWAAALLADYADLLHRWTAAIGNMVAAGLHAEYTALCGTVGSSVRVELPGGDTLLGTGTGIAEDGAIEVTDDGGTTHRFHAADVVHLRGI